MKLILAILFVLNASCATASDKKELPKPIVSEDIIYEGVIKCLSQKEASEELVSAVENDCSKYNMTSLIYTDTIKTYSCDYHPALVTVTWVYQCKAITDDKHMEIEETPQ